MFYVLYDSTFFQCEKGENILRKTKIVTTIGPATNTYKPMKQLIQSGANVLRVNFSHGTIPEYENIFNLIKQIRTELNVPVAIMADTRGPEVRVKTFASGCSLLKKGKTFTFYGYDKEGSDEGVAVTEPSCFKNAKKGTVILANDALIKLKVLENTGKELVCKVITGGKLSNNKSISLRGIDLNLPYISEKDRNDLTWAFQNGCDMVACSFVSKVKDIEEIKALRDACKSKARIIAKIENGSGIKNLKSILDACDGVMVARGDLGVELYPTKLPKLEIKMINEALDKGKVSIVATEMLESMIHSPRPTRAETIDVANAVYYGASAVMLSAESAVGQYYDLAVKTMADICEQAEKDTDYKEKFFSSRYNSRHIRDVLSHSAVNISFKLDIKAIVLYTDSGKTATMISRFQPNVPVVAITNDHTTYNYLSQVWGITPVFSEHTGMDIYNLANSVVLTNKIAKPGDSIVVLTGTTDEISNSLRVLEVTE